MKKFKNIIICSYSRYEELKIRGYNKDVYADRNCPNHEWYYFSKTGQMRTIDEHNHIWTSIMQYCSLLEMDVPTGYLKRVR